jgi:hypothetical protein
MKELIVCSKCGNKDNFIEVHSGGYREHSWTQEANGRFIYERANYDKCDNIYFECGKCHADMTPKYRAFLQALFARWEIEEIYK